MSRNLIEQSALIWNDDHSKRQDNPPSEHEIELSKAISLKRIADALDGTDNTGLVQTLWKIDTERCRG